MPETNEALVAKIKSGIDVADNMLKLWQQNRGFIRKIASRYKGYEDMEDLEQQGYIGLNNAVEGYRPEESVSFITYAAFWIQQSMLRYIEKSGSAAGIPSHAQQGIRKYKRLVGWFKMQTGREPSDKEICRYMEISREELEDIRKMAEAGKIESLDRTIMINGEECAIGDMISSDIDIENSVLDKVQREQLKNIIWSAVDNLPAIQSRVIRLRYQEGKTLKEIGQCIGATTGQVRQHEYKALRGMERSRKRNMLLSFIQEHTYRHNSVSEFNRTWTSSTEFVALKLHEKMT